MKKFVFSVMLLFFPAIAYPFAFPIYDQAEFKNETYFHEKYGQNFMETIFTPNGEIKHVSSLKFSKASVVKFPKKIHENFMEEISGSGTFKKVMPYGPIFVDKCIDLTIRGKQFYVIQINIEFKLANTLNSAYVEPIIWIVSEENDSIKTEFFHVSESRFFEEYRRNVSIIAIADVNNDGQHEIILKDVRYAGSGFIIFEYQNGKLNSFEMDGDSWD
jgi:hypothetical protein